MKIAVSIWQDRVSNVFDFAGVALLVEVERDNDREGDRQQINLYGRTGLEKAAALKKAGVDRLICGAISRPVTVWLNEAGIQVVPFITGPLDQVLSAYLAGTLNQPRFFLPGCGRKRVGCAARGRGRHGRRWQQTI